MLKFFRRTRGTLLDEGRLRKYLGYAIGEIVLVVVGILIALQINNWNEGRKARNQFKQSILSLAEDIRKDTLIIQQYISSLKRQESAARLIIPILESKEKKIVDSLEFNRALGWMSRAIQMDYDTEVWNEIKRSGMYKIYGDPGLIDAIQTYYHCYNRRAQNWESAKDVRMEMRWLKYELLSQVDIDQWSSDNPQPYSKKAYEAIFNEKRVADLTKAIYYTSSLFIDYFETCKTQAVDVLKLIDKLYGDLEDNTL